MLCPNCGGPLPSITPRLSNAAMEGCTYCGGTGIINCCEGEIINDDRRRHWENPTDVDERG